MDDVIGVDDVMTDDLVKALEKIRQNDEFPERGEIEYDDLFCYFYRGGRANGIYERWYENGQLFKRANYKRGEREGLFEEWYPNGLKTTCAEYKGGELDGLEERWDKNGQLIERSNYKKGKLEGLSEYLRYDGRVESCEYSNGELLSRRIIPDFTPMGETKGERKSLNISSPKKKGGRKM